MLRGDEVIAVRPLPARTPCDLALVDKLARWQLAAHRRGCSILVQDASDELIELIALVGVDIPASPPS